MENMQQRATSTLNTMLVKLFYDILGIEERTLTNRTFTDLSMREIHVIEAINLKENSTMSDVAHHLRITLSTVTTAVNHLCNKGYVLRKRSNDDRRIVYVYLTTKGREVDIIHGQFHEDMIKSVMDVLDIDELETLTLALDKINDYFIKKYE